VFVVLAILCYSQNGDNPQEYLAKFFGCKLNMKFSYLKNNASTFFATCFELCAEIWRLKNSKRLLHL
jgi:hypothetical protein